MLPMAATKLISERVSANALAGVQAADVDETAGVIRGVVVCGPESANGRRYPNQTMSRDFAKYEGVSVNFDHLEHGSGSRRFDDRGGWLSNLRLGSDGRPRADLNVLKSDSRAAKVFELAKRNPNAFGLSHVAHCQTRMEGGVEIVEAIESVESVDIVADPATNKGLFEGRRKNVAKKTFQEVLNGLRKHPKFDAAKQARVRKFLLAAEDDAGMAGMMDAEVDEPAADSDPDDAMWSGFKAAIDAILAKYEAGELDAGAALKEIGTYLKTHEKLDSGKGEKADDTPPDDTTPEGKKPKHDPSTLMETVLSELDTAGVPARGRLINILCRLPEKADRDAIIAEAKGASTSGSGFMSQSRDQFAQGANGGKRQESKDSSLPAEPKDLAATFMED